jgi:hypothetical protein
VQIAMPGRIAAIVPVEPAERLLSRKYRAPQSLTEVAVRTVPTTSGKSICSRFSDPPGT